MQKLGVLEDTLFIPMLGRIYASEHCPQILYDKKALELKKKLPSGLIEQNMQNQYTLLASASRSANMDRIIRSFLERRPDGVIVQLGCGLETTYHRCDNGKAHWYAVDLPHVIEYRRDLLPEPKREFYISGDAFVKVGRNLRSCCIGLTDRLFPFGMYLSCIPEKRRSFLLVPRSVFIRW